MATQLTKWESAELSFKQYFAEGNRMQRLQQALGRPPESWVNMMLTTFHERPELYKCSPESVLKAGMEAAQMGLTIGGPGRQAALVPYGNECQLQVQYQGLKELARRHPDVDLVIMEAVHEGDQFEWKGRTQEPVVHHSGSKTRQFDPVTGAFCTVYFANGRCLSQYWTVDECIAHRNKYVKSNVGREDSPWNPKNPGFRVMCAKTVMRSLVARGDIPLRVENPAVILSDEEGSGFEPAPVVEGTVVVDSPQQPQQLFDADGKPAAQPGSLDWKQFESELKACKTIKAVGECRTKWYPLAASDSDRVDLNQMCTVREETIRAKR